METLDWSLIWRRGHRFRSDWRGLRGTPRLVGSGERERRDGAKSVRSAELCGAEVLSSGPGTPAGAVGLGSSPRRVAPAPRAPNPSVWSCSQGHRRVLRAWSPHHAHRGGLQDCGLGARRTVDRLLRDSVWAHVCGAPPGRGQPGRMDLDQLDLNPRIAAAARRAKLGSAREILRFSGPDLQRLTGLSGPDVQHLLRTASSRLQGSSVLTGGLPRGGQWVGLRGAPWLQVGSGAGRGRGRAGRHGASPVLGREAAGSVAGHPSLPPPPPPPPALHLLQQKERFPGQHQRLSLGCPVLDELLGGGLPLEGITELAGRSSAGKTQLALQLCLAVQLPRRHGGLAAGECGGAGAPAPAALPARHSPLDAPHPACTGVPELEPRGWRRAVTLLPTGAVYVCTEDAFPHRRLQQLVAQQPQLRQDVPEDTLRAVRFQDQIFVEHAADADALLDCVQRKAPALLARGTARLLVIDSVAAPLRCEFTGPATAPRARHLQRLGHTLRRLSWTFRSPVLCINQVTDTVEEQDTGARPQGPRVSRVSPALGLAWANQLLLRLMVDRRRPEEGPGCSPPGRTLHVLSAPHLPPSSCSYTVSAEGVRGVPGTMSR
ncbi:DNA repair protein XRCC3 [Galemys pyrenaicus]|uniref:DNA repair protein XRCC3 n=1 Tax=Galemys pyrenaicus TaxID=202257 RepID=A0A8J6A2Z8_GALPY|nr:DNA repair protein XRCC3 [Galemys pyrenaicus]